MLLSAVLLSLIAVAHGFLPIFTRVSVSHGDITRLAALRKTAEVCRDIAAREGRYFSLNIDDSLTVEKVQRACSPSKTSVVSTIKFYSSLYTMVFSNAAIDVIYLFTSVHHVTDEALVDGRELITRGKAAVKASVRNSHFFTARRILGATLHTVQDFYSHSNWVEMGRTYPYSTLIQPDQPFVNLAGPDVPTCRSCIGNNCDNNILPEVLRKGLITTSYFNFFSRRKPQGKCSHGGTFDRTSYGEPKGGINKDSVSSSHSSLHFEAAAVAVRATEQFLEDIRLSVGDKKFLRLMGLTQSSVLCFVIDTTESMADDVAQVKRNAFAMIDSRRGTLREPPAYILVPFNDPDVGPLQMTTNADEFKASINRLTFGGGGDIPEMSLSGLQLALTAAPPDSEIFLFTDAPAKDMHLKTTVLALMESTKSTVTIMMTHKSRRGRRFATRYSLATTEDRLYNDLSSVSGGLSIYVEKSELHNAMDVIKDSSDSAVVTVFQIERTSSRKGETFQFTVDQSLQNVVVYITGSPSLTFHFTDPTGVTQTSRESRGRLGSMTTVGNLCRISLSNQTGVWDLVVKSKYPYSVKVTGQSSINFIFNLVEESEGVHAGFSLKEGRPSPGGNATLAITVSGGDTAEVTEVLLWESLRQTKVSGALKSFKGGSYLVWFTGIPAGDYVVIVKGTDNNSSFQRQAPTRLKTSSISVTAKVNDTSIEPGASITVPFQVAMMSDGLIDDHATGTFNIKANNDRSFPSTSPDSLTIQPGDRGKSHGVVTLTTPTTAASGSDVTLTIVVQSEVSSEVNFVMLQFSIIAEVKDIYRPLCQAMSSSNCTSPSPCSSSTWEFVTNITDAGGSGVSTIKVHQGDGTLNTSTVTGSDGESVTMVTYSATCCTRKVVLAAVDGAGNVGTCVGQATNRAGLFSPATLMKNFIWSSIVVLLSYK